MANSNVTPKLRDTMTKKEYLQYTITKLLLGGSNKAVVNYNIVRKMEKQLREMEKRGM